MTEIVGKQCKTQLYIIRLLILMRCKFIFLVKNQAVQGRVRDNVILTEILFYSSVEKRRPERLLSRLKSMNDEMIGPRVVVLRPPKGPDGTRGFSQPRTPWNPPS